MVGSSDLTARMGLFEAGSERVAGPGSFVVVRLAGRGFSRLLRGRHELDRPLDVRVRDILIATADHLMNCGAATVFAYTHSDEIAVLLRRGEAGELGALAAGFAGEASAKCTLLLGALAGFTARVVELPDAAAVVDYFRWRREAAGQAALRAHCGWALQQRGMSEAAARERVAAGLAGSPGELGVDVEALPGWQTEGVGLVWERPEPVVNPRTGAPVALRRRVRVLLELDAGEAYAALLREQAAQAG